MLKRIVAGTVTAVMLLSTVPTGAFAARPESVGGPRPFTNTQDLINQVAGDLAAAGQYRQAEDRNDAVAAAVEQESDYSYDQAASEVVRGLMDNREDNHGSMDLSYLNLSADTMQELLQDTMQSYGFDDSVSFTCTEQDGVVTDVDFVVEDALVQVMDEITEAPQQVFTAGTLSNDAEEPLEEKPFPFEDVEEDRWSRYHINYLYQRGMVSGVSETRFAPESDMTRAMVVTILWSMQGKPAPKTQQSFPDVPASEWYAEPVRWAQENELVSGFPDGTFHPNEGLAREQLVQIMFRYAENVDGKMTDARAELTDFADADKISSWAREAAGWAVATGVISGEKHGDQTFFLPADVATREEYAAIACSYLENSVPVDHTHEPSVDEEGNYVDAKFNWSEVSPFVLDEQGNPVMHEGQPIPSPEVFFLDKNGGPILQDGKPAIVGAYLDGTPIQSLTLTFNPDAPHDAENGDKRISPMPTMKPDYWLDWNDKNNDYKMDKDEIAEAMENLHHRDTLVCDSVTFTCADCGKEVTVDATATAQLMTEDWINQQANAAAEQAAGEFVQNYVGQKVQEYMQAHNGEMPSEEQQNQWVEEGKKEAEPVAQQAAMNYFMQNIPNLNSTIYVAAAAENAELTETRNATGEQLLRNWGIMRQFNAAYPQYLGYAAPYWTSKNTEAKPMDAVIYMCNAQEEPFVPTYNMDFMVSMLTQAFMSYIMSYGPMVDAMVGEALQTVNHSELTDVQKMLLLHDWVAQYGTFDMQSMIDQTRDSSVGSDPIAMTIFGTLLRDQIPQDPTSVWDGSVCLGYTSTYAILLQQAFGKTSTEDPIVDFVQIKYLSNVADTSVAAGESGFGDGDDMFNSPHFFNAVKLDNKWYYVDTCYDDVNVEVISQYRVETDGNVSHDNFLLAPTTVIDMYDPNFQFIDSLYDNKVWERVPDGNGGYMMITNLDRENPIPEQEANNKKKAYDEEHKETDEKVLQLFYYYEKKDAPAGTETEYSDTTYEEAWFVHANSPVIYDSETGYFYYASGMVNSYASMKDIFKDQEGEQGQDSMGDMFEGMDMGDLLKFKENPASQDKLVRRAQSAPDKPEPKDDNGMSMNMGDTEDPHAEHLFHYGYGSIGAAAQKDVELDKDSNPMEGGSVEGREGPYYAEVIEDQAYFGRYPDLTHSMVRVGDKLFFNIGHTVYSFNKTVQEMGSQKISEMNDLTLVPIKEYNDVSYGHNGKRFEGGGFTTDVETRDRSLRYHPIAAMDVHNKIVWTDADGDGQPDGRQVIPTLFVSIGTNYSRSYKGSSSEFYQEEACNFNPNFFRFNDEEKTEEEKEKENDNVEFMWCANVVDKMPVEEMLTDLSTGNASVVTVEPWCEHDGFSESRTNRFGLTRGDRKVQEGTALKHVYEMNDTEHTNICTRCKDAHEHTYGAEHEFVWAQEGDKLTCTTSITCEDPFCDVKAVPECVVTEENGVFTATSTLKTTDADGNEVENVDTETRTLEQFNHKHTYGEPVFNWTEDHSACTAVFTCTAGEDVCLNTDEKRVQEVSCTVTHDGEGEHQDHTATCTFEEKTYTETLHGQMEQVAEQAPTCEKDGIKAHWHCAVCNKNFEDEAGKVELTDIVLPATGHDWGDPTYEWSEDNTKCTATHTCKNDPEHKEIATAKVTSKVTKEPTETEEGVKTYTATFTEKWAEEQVKTETLPKLEHVHKWGAPTYEWSEDNTKCTAKRVCETNPEHIETAVGTVTSKITKQPTETEEGVKTYTATFTEEWAEEQVKTETLPKLKHEHKWGATTYEWSEDGKTCTAKRVCETNPEHVETAVGTVTSKVTKEPTATTKGETTYTAKFEVSWATEQTKTLADIDVLPAEHTHVLANEEAIISQNWIEKKDGRVFCTIEYTCAECKEVVTATAEAHKIANDINPADPTYEVFFGEVRLTKVRTDIDLE